MILDNDTLNYFFTCPPVLINDDEETLNEVGRFQFSDADTFLYVTDTKIEEIHAIKVFSTDSSGE